MYFCLLFIAPSIQMKAVTTKNRFHGLLIFKQMDEIYSVGTRYSSQIKGEIIVENRMSNFLVFILSVRLLSIRGLQHKR